MWVSEAGNTIVLNPNTITGCSELDEYLGGETHGETHGEVGGETHDNTSDCVGYAAQSGNWLSL